MALNIKTFDRLRKKRPGMIAALAADLGVSVSCIKMLRKRAGTVGYGTRIDGHERVEAINNWMRKARGSGK